MAKRAPRILIADDDSFVRQMARGILETAGCEIVGEAVNGVEAIKQFEALQPDIVMMDTVMPKPSGIDSTKDILAKDPDAIIIMCGTLGQQTLVMEALYAGARDFVVKPYETEKVIKTVSKHVDRMEGISLVPPGGPRQETQSIGGGEPPGGVMRAPRLNFS